jgi:SAM-dependent methyltransferase
MAEEQAIRWDGRAYARRFADLAAAGNDTHGEATLCSTRFLPGSRVLDAGCGTGRVAVRLAELGYVCVGIDVDASMLAVAREASTDVTWRQLDLADVDQLEGSFDLVVAAGNVIPLLRRGTGDHVVARLAGCLRAGGELVAGFGLDAAHLPGDTAPVGVSDYDAWCAAAGLTSVARFSTWSQEPYRARPGYAVSIHRRP